MTKKPKLKNCAIQLTWEMVEDIQGHKYHFPPVPGQSSGLGSGVSGFVRHCVEFSLAQEHLFEDFMELRVEAAKEERRKKLKERKKRLEEELARLNNLDE